MTNNQYTLEQMAEFAKGLALDSETAAMVRQLLALALSLERQRNEALAEVKRLQGLLVPKVAEEDTV